MSGAYRCAGCRNPLAKREFIQCSICKGRYDAECANLNIKIFNLSDRKNLWKCPECTSKRPKKGNVNTPVRSAAIDVTTGNEPRYSEVVEDTVHDEENITLRSKSTRARIPSVSNSDSPHTDTDSNNHEYTGLHDTTVKDLKIYMKELLHTQTASIKDAIAGLTSVIEAQNSRIEQLEARITALESKSSKEQQPNTSAIENAIKQLQADNAERDQACLLNDLEIVGCAEVANENCVHLAMAIAKKISVDLDEKDIVSVNRVGQERPTGLSDEQARPRPLVLRLARRATREALLQAARLRRNLNSEGLEIPEPIRNLYINERLTKHNRILFQKTRAKAKEMKYKYVWTRDGKIFIRKEDGHTRHRISTEIDLIRVFGKTDI